MTMPFDTSPQPKTPPVRTAVGSATTVESESGPVEIQAGYEQYATQDHGLTAKRPVVTITIGDKLHQLAAPEAHDVGMTLMLAASMATAASTEENP